MKTNFNPAVTLLLCFISLLFINPVAAQTPATDGNEQSKSAAPTATNVAPPMGEDEHLAFMQDEQRGSSAASATESSSGSLLLRTLGAMLLIVGLIFFGAWGVRKFGANFGLFQSSNLAKPNAPDLTVLNTVGLGTGRSLVIVRFGERNLLIGSTAQSFTLLAEDETSREQTVLPRSSRSVADLLAEENNSFADELDSADERLNLFGKHII